VNGKAGAAAAPPSTTGKKGVAAPPSAAGKGGPSAAPSPSAPELTSIQKAAVVAKVKLKLLEDDFLHKAGQVEEAYENAVRKAAGGRGRPPGTFNMDPKGEDMRLLVGGYVHFVQEFDEKTNLPAHLVDNGARRTSCHPTPGTGSQPTCPIRSPCGRWCGG
jgi:hypothetical protein